MAVVAIVAVLRHEHGKNFSEVSQFECKKHQNQKNSTRSGWHVMKQEIHFQPAFDKCHPDPNKNYGIHGASMRWLVIGDEGAVQFVVYTNWHLPHIRREAKTEPGSIVLIERYPFEFWQAPTAADLGYHSKVPRYEGQTSMGQECDILGGECYYDGSTLNAEPVFELLIAEGHEAVWDYLKQYYKDIFNV